MYSMHPFIKILKTSTFDLYLKSYCMSLEATKTISDQNSVKSDTCTRSFLVSKLLERSN